MIDQVDTRLYALLNISAMGMLSPKIGELEDLRWADVEDAVEVGRANRDRVLGIKARLSRPQAADNDVYALKRAIEAAEILDGFVMIHVGDTRTPLEELVAMLRSGGDMRRLEWRAIARLVEERRSDELETAAAAKALDMSGFIRSLEIH